MVLQQLELDFISTFISHLYVKLPNIEFRIDRLFLKNKIGKGYNNNLHLYLDTEDAIG